MLLGLARACVLLLPFAGALKLFRGRAARRDMHSDPATPGPAAQRVARAIAVASRYTPWDSNCLAQALAAGAMLRMRGAASVLHIGVARPGDSLEAHAWLTSGDLVVCGGSGHDRYAVVSTF